MTNRSPEERIDELLSRNTELLFELRDERRKNADLERTVRNQIHMGSIFHDEIAQLLAESMGYPMKADDSTYHDVGKKSLLDMVMEACQMLQTEGAHV